MRDPNIWTLPLKARGPFRQKSFDDLVVRLGARDSADQTLRCSEVPIVLDGYSDSHRFARRLSVVLGRSWLQLLLHLAHGQPSGVVRQRGLVGRGCPGARHDLGHRPAERSIHDGRTNHRQVSETSGDHTGVVGPASLSIQPLFGENWSTRSGARERSRRGAAGISPGRIGRRLEAVQRIRTLYHAGLTELRAHPRRAFRSSAKGSATLAPDQAFLRAVWVAVRRGDHRMSRSTISAAENRQGQGDGESFFLRGALLGDVQPGLGSTSIGSQR